MCLMSFTHAEILKSYPYEILDGEKISFDYIESDKCNFQRKDLKSSINRILEINKMANSNMRCDSFKSLMIINKLSKFL